MLADLGDKVSKSPLLVPLIACVICDAHTARDRFTRRVGSSTARTAAIGPDGRQIGSTTAARGTGALCATPLPTLCAPRLRTHPHATLALAAALAARPYLGAKGSECTGKRRRIR